MKGGARRTPRAAMVRIHGLPLALLALVVPERPIEWSLPLIGAFVYNAVGGMVIGTLLWLYILARDDQRHELARRAGRGWRPAAPVLREA